MGTTEATVTGSVQNTPQQGSKQGNLKNFLGYVLLGKRRLYPPWSFSRERRGFRAALPLFLGYDEDVVEQEEVAEPAGAPAEDAPLFRQQQVQLPPLQQPAGRRDQRERLKRTQRKSRLPPVSQAAGKITQRSCIWARSGPWGAQKLTLKSEQQERMVTPRMKQ